ncbi:hypothetical protein L596_005721 [Steinernema carpocapsae]|uniref:Uncharacterized protein n=1 Tax=Steinernema carpocapsae TaxID=34508 RepID=A0A4U8V019_STECR|nr:hypothetical protein L596_005721 [Steinernema carpocapsae]
MCIDGGGVEKQHTNTSRGVRLPVVTTSPRFLRRRCRRSLAERRRQQQRLCSGQTADRSGQTGGWLLGDHGESTDNVERRIVKVVLSFRTLKKYPKQKIAHIFLKGKKGLQTSVATEKTQHSITAHWDGLIKGLTLIRGRRRSKHTRALTKIRQREIGTPRKRPR